MLGLYKDAVKFETVLADVFESQRQREFDRIREETPDTPWINQPEALGLGPNYTTRDTYPLPGKIKHVAKWARKR
jgi:hypothetical protein